MTTQPQFVTYPGFTNIAADLTALTANDIPGLPNGFQVYVVAEREIYRLDTANPLTTSSPLIVARGATAGAGKWYRRSRAYVVGNFTLWGSPFGGTPLSGTGDSKIGGFTPGQLTVSNANAPDIILDLSAAFPPATITVLDVLVDGLGNLWVCGMNSATTAGTISKFLLIDCLVSGSPAASVTITFTVPNGASVGGGPSWAFDKQNNLWGLLGGRGATGAAALVKYNQTTYANTGTPTPDVTLSLFNAGLQPSTSDAISMAFDTAGNLWFTALSTNAAFAGGVLMIAASQLNVTNAAILPAVFWTGSNITASARGLCFGPTGSLWVLVGNTLLAFDPRSPVSGNQAPIITITSATFNAPISMQFDTSGNLWICNDNNNKIYRIPAASLTASGAVVPDVILTQTTILAFLTAITFPNNPNRSGLLPSGVPVTP